MCQALPHHHTWCHQLRFSGGTTPSSCTCLTPVEYNKLAAAVCCILSCCALIWHLPKTLSASRLVHGCMHGGHMFNCFLGHARTSYGSNAGWEVQPTHSMVGINLGCNVLDKFGWVCCAFGQHSAVALCANGALARVRLTPHVLATCT
jgi:hypothetical protein